MPESKRAWHMSGGAHALAAGAATLPASAVQARPLPRRT